MTSSGTVKEQINAELTAAQIAAVRVLQPATEPTRPVFPNYGLMLPGAVISSLGLSAALVILKGWLFKAPDEAPPPAISCMQPASRFS
jgi:uncharacterized protein involved in exopolysaccharide biosynthesis